MTEHAFTYDVAFSFLTADQGTAVALRERLRDLNCFLYTERQSELEGPGGFDKFAAVFGEDARVVVVVYRDGWGNAGFTLVESTAIKNRFLTKGPAFLSVIVPETQPKPKLPHWFSIDHVYWNTAQYGLDGAAQRIRQRVKDVGGSPAIETAGERAAREQRERWTETNRRSFVVSEGTAAARAEMQTLYTTLADIAKASAGALNEPEWNNARTAISIATRARAPKLLFSLGPNANTPPGPVLWVKLCRQGVLREFQIPGMGPSAMHTSEYEIDRDENGRIGWRSKRPADGVTQSSAAVVDRAVMRMLDTIASERR